MALHMTRRFTRLLKETGRHSISPIFVVGVYSGADKLGEGFGSSLKMAEYRVRFCPVLFAHYALPLLFYLEPCISLPTVVA